MPLCRWRVRSTFYRWLGRCRSGRGLKCVCALERLLQTSFCPYLTRMQ